MVSIVLVTYNRSERLKLSIQDILDQTFKNFELIICDDCSTDSTQDICHEFLSVDNRIKYYRHASNMQMPANCNFGIQKSMYEYIAILHDGDRFRPDLIEQWYDAISNHETVGFVFNSIGQTDGNENIVLSHHDFEEGVIEKDHLLKNEFFRRWHFDSPVYGEAMVRKKLVEKYGFLKKKHGFYADVDLWMQLLHSHDAYYCADTLITGPTKKIQPRLFDDNMIKTFLYMFSMHLTHRKKAYKDQPLKLIKELGIFWTQAFFSLNYNLMLIVKNFSFVTFFGSARLLRRSFIFLIPWIIILFLYPLLYPFLKLFIALKNGLPKLLPISR